MNKYSSSQCVTCFDTVAALPYNKVFKITPWPEKTKFQEYRLIKNKSNVIFTKIFTINFRWKAVIGSNRSLLLM